MADANGAAASVSLTVKFGAQNFPLSLPSASTVKDLKTLLQPLTNLLLRGQKLIFKGKVLADAMTIDSAGLSNGSKIMLMASHGLHQGDGPITSNTSMASKSHGTSSHHVSPFKLEVHKQKNHLERWKVTGVVALSGCSLNVIPEEVLACGASVRLLDLSHNSIQQVPLEIGKLKSLRKLLLNANNLGDEAINWDGVSSLKLLTVLSLNENQLTTIPDKICSLASLKELHIAKNNLTSLPEEIHLLSELQVLNASRNRLSALPSSIGDCASLVEADFSYNHLAKLPDTLGKLHSLKSLIVANNGLKNLPSSIFKCCSNLSSLDLHRTEITVEQLREFVGWEEFDERRRAKQQKQLDFRAGFNSSLDEGADIDNGSNY